MIQQQKNLRGQGSGITIQRTTELLNSVAINGLETIRRFLDQQIEGIQAASIENVALLRSKLENGDDFAKVMKPWLELCQTQIQRFTEMSRATSKTIEDIDKLMDQSLATSELLPQEKMLQNSEAGEGRGERRVSASLTCFPDRRRAQATKAMSSTSPFASMRKAAD